MESVHPAGIRFQLRDLFSYHGIAPRNSSRSPSTCQPVDTHTAVDKRQLTAACRLVRFYAGCSRQMLKEPGAIHLMIGAAGVGGDDGTTLSLPIIPDDVPDGAEDGGGTDDTGGAWGGGGV
jgi:hypothetical protein